MTTMTPGRVRRGLPRVPGGEPWPPVSETAAPTAAGVQVSLVADAEAPHRAEVTPEPTALTDAARTLRRGLPRVPGGEPWPPAAVAASSAEPAEAAVPVSPAAGAQPPGSAEVTHEPAASARLGAPVSLVADAEAPGPVAATLQQAQRGAARALRRGLPRVPGGEPWPPPGWVPAMPAHTDAPVPGVADAEASDYAEVTPEPDRRATRQPEAAKSPAPAPAAVAVRDVSAPLPFPQTVYPGAAALAWNAQRNAAASVAPRDEAKRYGPFTRVQWAGAVVVGGVGMLVAAAFVVLAVRWLVSLEFMRDFLTAYPGQYTLPASAPVGIPGWLGWQHFFNVFLIVLIIRTGITVHNEKRPGAFWSPRTNSKRKISLTLWFHQSLDILWLVNGVAYVVLLLVTAQWMRIVPTSWAVFPNALSAGVQYVSLNWPTENGWVNYNSLQQLAYFATVFIAAPLAAITGVRMSGVWPKNAQTLSRLYPLEWARKVHFPVMVYFVAFIVVHVALVFATNALRNLNHMYGGQDAVNWTGLWIFIASMIVVAAGWVAARPLVLAPIARLFGTVSAR